MRGEIKVNVKKLQRGGGKTKCHCKKGTTKLLGKAFLFKDKWTRLEQEGSRTCPVWYSATSSLFLVTYVLFLAAPCRF